MQISNKGINFLKGLEGFKESPYLDRGGILTIGYGHVILSNEIELKKAQLTEDEATSLLIDDLHKWENYINCTISLYDITLSQCQFDALCSFCFNLGTFKPAMLIRFKNNDLNSVGNSILLYNTIKGKVIDGLTIRRQKESQLFLQGIYE